MSHENILNNVIDDDSEDDSISIGRIKTELGFTEDNGVLEFKRAVRCLIILFFTVFVSSTKSMTM